MLNVPLCIQNFYIVSTERESNVRSGRVLITPDRHLPQRTGFGQCVGPQLNLANSPASECVADSAAGGHYARSNHHLRCYRHTWGYHNAWCCGAAGVYAAVVPVASAAAIWAAVKTKPTSTGDRDG